MPFASAAAADTAGREGAAGPAVGGTSAASMGPPLVVAGRAAERAAPSATGCSINDTVLVRAAGVLVKRAAGLSPFACRFRARRMPDCNVRARFWPQFCCQLACLCAPSLALLSITGTSGTGADGPVCGTAAEMSIGVAGATADAVADPAHAAAAVPAGCVAPSC
jgi:hypothetical protein